LPPARRMSAPAAAVTEWPAATTPVLTVYVGGQGWPPL
jgi:hypothetical protein